MKQGLQVIIGGLLFLTLSSASLLAEELPGKQHSIKGVIIDANKKTPLAYAHIILRDAADSSIVKATYTGVNGAFILVNVPNGKYTIRISYVGYEHKDIPDFEVEGSAPDEMNIGTVALAEASVEMNEVTIEAERPTEEFHLDKKVINVSQTMYATGGNALDVLRNQPSIQVDANDNVTLRGSSNFTILVNGRPSPFQGTDALKQIPANIIENIELITNPSAKYEAEGASGIININTKKQTENTTRSIVNLTTGTRDKYSGDVTVSHSTGPVTLTGGLNYGNNFYTMIQEVERSTTADAGGVYNKSEMDRREKRKDYTMRLGLEYNADDKNIISLNGSGGLIDIYRSFDFEVLDRTPNQQQYVIIDNGFSLDAYYYTGTAVYTHKFVPKMSELSFEGVYSGVTLPYDQITQEYQSDATFTQRSLEPYSKNQDTENKRQTTRLKMDYFYTFSEVSKLETGLFSSLAKRDYDVAYSIFNWSNDVWELDETLTNKYDYKDNVYAAYVTYSNALLEFQFQAGLRAEYMDRLLEQKTLSEEYQYDKLDFFPTFSISRKLGGSQLQFSYSRRITRPQDNALNPFPYYSDAYLVSTGNPYLLPEYANSYELNFQKMFPGVFFSVQTYFRSATNSIWRAQSVDDNGRLTVGLGNFAKTQAYGAEISSSYSPWSWLRLDPNINVFNYSISGIAFNDDIDQDFFTWTARLNTTFTLSQSTRIQLTGMYLSEQISPQSTTDPLFYLNVSARQDFFDRAFSVTLRANNLLTTSYYDVSSSGVNFSNSFLIKPEVGNVHLTLSWNFNNFRPTRRPDEGVDVNIGG